MKYFNSLNKNLANEKFSVKEVAEIIGKSERTIKYYCKQGKLIAELVEGNGGKQYRIDVEASYKNEPDKLTEFYKKTNPNQRGNAGTLDYLNSKLPVQQGETSFQKTIPAEPFSLEERRKQGLELYYSVPSYDRKRADKKLEFITFTNRIGTSLRGKEFEEALNKWNAENPDKTMCYNTGWNAYKAFNEAHLAGLVSNYRVNRGKTSVEDGWFNDFKSLYLVEGAPSVNSCWIQVLGKAKILNPELDVNKFPKGECFKRRLDNEISKGTQYFLRYGQARWNRRYGNYVDRDYSKLRVNQLWVSDHRQTDIFVIHNGKPVRLWATVWSDAKTRKILSVLLYPEPPNSDHIFQSFQQAVLKYGLPEEILIDNGKDYRCKDFAGGRTNHKVEVDEVKTRSMLSLIGVVVHFSLPYRAQTKPIERIFRDLITGFEVHIVGYSGGNAVERPEKLKDEIKKGQIYDSEVMKLAIINYIENVYNNMPSESKALQGKSPNQAWAEGLTVKNRISKEELKLFCMRTSNDVTIGRNGVKDSKINAHYWADWMSGQKGRKVYVRRDIDEPVEAWIFDAKTDEFMGNAEIVEKVDFLAKHEESKLKLREAISRDRADIKFNKSLKPALKGDLIEILENMKAGAQALSGGAEEANPKVINSTNTKMKDVIKQAEKLEKDKKQRKEAMDEYFARPKIKPEKPKIYPMFDCEIEQYNQSKRQNSSNS